MSEILIFGAGNIGRSFIGQIFSRAGFQVVFVDLDRELVDALNEHSSYTVVQRDPSGNEEHLEIGPVRAVYGGDSAAVAEALARIRYVATAVGAAALPVILPILTREMERRRQSASGGPPLDIILAENIHGAGQMVREAVSGAGVVECSVGKMVPIVPQDVREQNIRTVYAESYNTLIVDRDGWTNPIPAVPELFPVSPIAAWIDRKLYIHNLGHATCAYTAYSIQNEIQYIWQATAREDVREQTRSVMVHAARGLIREYPRVFTMEDLETHIDDLLYRFSSRTLGDTVYRVGRDLQRKLGPADRIVGTLSLLRRHRCDTAPLEEVYRRALRFRATDEAGRLFPADQEFLDRLSAATEEEKKSILAEVSGFDVNNQDDAALLNRLVS